MAGETFSTWRGDGEAGEMVSEGYQTIRRHCELANCHHDSQRSSDCSGPIVIKNWAERFLDRMGLVKCQAATKAKVTPSNFGKVKQQYLADIPSFVFIEEIPDDLIINWDQTSEIRSSFGIGQWK